MVVKTISLTSINKGVAPVIYAVHGDTNRSLRMVVSDMTLMSGMTGQLVFVRSDGTFYGENATIDIANNRFTADITQALTQLGVTKCQLKISQDAKVISTYEFLIKIEPSLSGVVEEQEYWTIQHAIEIAVEQTDINTRLDRTAYITNATIDSIMV